jgi:hypothetical protein
VSHWDIFTPIGHVVCPCLIHRVLSRDHSEFMNHLTQFFNPRSLNSCWRYSNSVSNNPYRFQPYPQHFGPRPSQLPCWGDMVRNLESCHPIYSCHHISFGSLAILPTLWLDFVSS